MKVNTAIDNSSSGAAGFTTPSSSNVNSFAQSMGLGRENASPAGPTIGEPTEQEVMQALNTYGAMQMYSMQQSSIKAMQQAQQDRDEADEDEPDEDAL